MIPAVSFIMTPVALLFKSIQLKADKYASEEKKVEINEKQNY